MTTKPTIAFIGLGNMGRWMADNILKNGFTLHVHDLDRSRAEPLILNGASWAASPAAAADRAEVVITSLPGPEQVKTVVLAPDGLLAHLQAGQTWIDMTTNDPELLKRIDKQAAAREVRILEAPVTGAVDGARDGRLSIFAGGDPALFNEMQPVLSAMGTSFHTGPIGTGNIAKLVTNLLWFIHAAAIGEGLVLGAKAGIDLETLWSIIKSSAGNSWVAEHDVPSIFAGHYDPSFSLDLCAKDLRLTMAAGESLGVPLPLGGLVQQIFRQAQADYGGDQGELHVVRLLEDASGVSLRVEGYE